MKLTGNNLEIRAVDIKTSTTTGNQYILLRVEDDYGSWSNAIDRNMEHKVFYKKGIVADFTFDLRQTKNYSSLSVIDVKIKAEH